MMPPAYFSVFVVPFRLLSAVYVADETVDKIYVSLHKDRRTFTDYNSETSIFLKNLRLGK